jgi:hypothetical protein
LVGEVEYGDRCTGGTAADLNHSKGVKGDRNKFQRII